jgi:hypothetical protein
MMGRVIVGIFFCLCPLLNWAQEPATDRPDPSQITRQFGPAFQPLANFPVLTADFDGDGTEDAVVAATADDPFLDQAAFHYQVVDPLGSYFGWNDPKVTRQFALQTDKPPLLLIVENWRAPKGKFVVANVPFEKLSLSRVLVKKRTVPAICADEMNGMKSKVYWDGKKWKWKEASME